MSHGRNDVFCLCTALAGSHLSAADRQRFDMTALCFFLPDLAVSYSFFPLDLCDVVSLWLEIYDAIAQPL